MKSELKMPNFKFIPAPITNNVAMMTAENWKGREIAEATRDGLPVLHNRAYVNCAVQSLPSTSPAPTTILGDPIWVEPPQFFGKRQSQIKRVRSLSMLCLASFWQSFLADNPTALNNGEVFRWLQSVNDIYDGFLLEGLPWASLDLINLPNDYLPTAESPSKYTGGEYLSIVCLGAHAGYGQDAWSHDVLLPSDIAQLAASLPSFTKFAVRLHGFTGQTGASIAFYNSLTSDVVAAGIDCTFQTGEPTLASIRADYTAFFGL